MTVLQVQDLDARHGLLRAVHGVSFSVDRGDVLALVGANGAGKTTMLRAIAGAHPVRGGAILFNGTDVTRLPSHRRAALGLALVPEGRRLFGPMTVLENLKLATAIGRPGPWTIETVLDAFPNLKGKLRSRASSLSGGEQQAAAICRALLTNPEIILLDEISLGLSPLVVEGVYTALRRLIADGTTIILVEQDLKRALSVATQVICMLEGKIALAGSAGQISEDEVTEAYFGIGRKTHDD